MHSAGYRRVWRGGGAVDPSPCLTDVVSQLFAEISFLISVVGTGV